MYEMQGPRRALGTALTCRFLDCQTLCPAYYLSSSSAHFVRFPGLRANLWVAPRSVCRSGGERISTASGHDRARASANLFQDSLSVHRMTIVYPPVSALIHRMSTHLCTALSHRARPAKQFLHRGRHPSAADRRRVPSYSCSGPVLWPLCSGPCALAPVLWPQ